jgi:hypothetical protein
MDGHPPFLIVIADEVGFPTDPTASSLTIGARILLFGHQ